MNKQTQCCNCLTHLKNECNIDLEKDKEYIGQNIIKINKDEKQISLNIRNRGEKTYLRTSETIVYTKN